MKVVYNFCVYPRESKVITTKKFVIIKKSGMGGTQWTCFYIKDSKSYTFDSFGVSSDIFSSTITKTSHFSFLYISI